MNLVYLIGAPGAGKTALARAVEARWELTATVEKPFARRIYESPRSGRRMVSLGRERDQFAGTDTLGMAVGPKAIEWLTSHPASLVFGEGDRLGYAKFFDAMREANVNLTVVMLDTPPADLAARRAQRGSNQNETWLKGRESKVAGLRPYADLTLDGRMSTAVLLDALFDQLPQLNPDIS